MPIYQFLCVIFYLINFVKHLKNVAEFHLSPDKRCLYLAETTLQFSVLLPEAFIPDNGFCAKSNVIYFNILVNFYFSFRIIGIPNKS